MALSSALLAPIIACRCPAFPADQVVVYLECGHLVQHGALELLICHVAAAQGIVDLATQSVVLSVPDSHSKANSRS